MEYLLQLYRQENSLKCRLCNKLLIDDIHITITEGRVYVAVGIDYKKESNANKAVDLRAGCTVRNCLTWFNREIFLLM